MWKSVKNSHLKGPRSDSSLPLPWRFGPDVRRRWLPGSTGCNGLPRGATFGPPRYDAQNWSKRDLSRASRLHSPNIFNLIVSGHVVLSWCVLPALDPAISAIAPKVVHAAASSSSVFATQMPWLPWLPSAVPKWYTCLGSLLGERMTWLPWLTTTGFLAIKCWRLYGCTWWNNSISAYCRCNSFNRNHCAKQTAQTSVTMKNMISVHRLSIWCTQVGNSPIGIGYLVRIWIY